MSTPRLYDSEFASILAATFVTQGITSLKIGKDFHKKLQDSLDKHLITIEKWKKLNFLIRCHPFHGDSETVDDMFASLMSKDMGYYDHPHYDRFHLKCPEELSDYFLSKLPPEIREVFAQIAREITS
jgi:hypothetical protein